MKTLYKYLTSSSAKTKIPPKPKFIIIRIIFFSNDTEDCIKGKIAALCTKEDYSTLFECTFFKKCKDPERTRMACLKEFCGDDEYKQYHHAFQCRKIKAMDQIVHIQI